MIGVCGHCGAVWDQAHEEGRCGVADATRAMLSPRPPDPRPVDELLMIEALSLAMAQTRYVERNDAKKWLRAKLGAPRG